MSLTRYFDRFDLKSLAEDNYLFTNMYKNVFFFSFMCVLPFKKNTIQCSKKYNTVWKRKKNHTAKTALHLHTSIYYITLSEISYLWAKITTFKIQSFIVVVGLYRCD